MIHGSDPARVVALALRIARRHGEARGPAVRVGVHSGTAVRRGSDWYGSTVNVAARLAEAAAPGEVLISLTTREELASAGPMTIADRGPRSFRASARRWASSPLPRDHPARVLAAAV